MKFGKLERSTSLMIKNSKYPCMDLKRYFLPGVIINQSEKEREITKKMEIFWRKQTHFYSFFSLNRFITVSYFLICEKIINNYRIPTWCEIINYSNLVCVVIKVNFFHLVILCVMNPWIRNLYVADSLFEPHMNDLMNALNSLGQCQIFKYDIIKCI